MKHPPKISLKHERELTVIAQDPGLIEDGMAVTTRLRVPAESLESGPRGARVQVIDYDLTNDQFYGPAILPEGDCPRSNKIPVKELVRDPEFHAQNVYAIVSATLFEFEKALGRRVRWGFGGRSHQLKVFPHAFMQANAYYSNRDECLAFGYYPKGDSSEMIFTCLSHDIVAHETAHALLDGLRGEFTRAGSVDQVAFHEGFADIVALLMVLKNEELVRMAVHGCMQGDKHGTVFVRSAIDSIKDLSFLFSIAEGMSPDRSGVARDALRRSLNLEPDKGLYTNPEYKEPHDRGEILVAAVMRAYIEVWELRLKGALKHHVHPRADVRVEIWRIVEEGAKAAQHLLGILIRAIDYLPPINIDFRDYLSATLTADAELYPNDTEYDYRGALTRSFSKFGIKPAFAGSHRVPGGWGPPRFQEEQLDYSTLRRNSLDWDAESMQAFVWQNRNLLGVHPDVFMRVNSVRPVRRIGLNGAILEETVVEYTQILVNATRAELMALQIEPPAAMNDQDSVDAYGGGLLIFDDLARLKYHVHNQVGNPTNLAELFSGAQASDQQNYSRRDQPRFAELHFQRASGGRS